MEHYRQVLIDAIIGVGMKGSMSYACEMTEKGLAVFTGNQWNENWSWSRTGLETLSFDQLLALYTDLKKDKANGQKTH